MPQVNVELASVDVLIDRFAADFATALFAEFNAALLWPHGSEPGLASTVAEVLGRRFVQSRPANHIPRRGELTLSLAIHSSRLELLVSRSKNAL
jgi:hypothetical protein